MTNRLSLPAIALCSEYSITVRGGVSVIVEELITALSCDFRFWLVSPDDPDELHQHPVASLIERHIPFRIPCLPPKQIYHRAAKELANRLHSEGIRLAHFHAGGTFGLGNRWPGASVPRYCADAGLKTLWTSHSTEPPSAGFTFHGRPAWISRMLSPLAVAGKTSQMRDVDAEIAVSEHDKAYLARHFPGAKDRLRRIYHSRLDADQAKATAPRQRTILAVGHVAFRKGQDVLVRAFLEIAPQFPEWELVLAGHDAGDGCWQWIERAKAEHPEGTRIRLLGAHPKPMELMATAGVFVQPSREEALGLALQEALFMGCPTIGSRVGGIPEVIDEGHTGLLVPSDRPDALASALSTLIEDEKLRTRFGAVGRESILAKCMTRRDMIESHRQLYQEILSQP